MAKAQGSSKHTMNSTKSPARRGIEVISLLIVAVVLSFIYPHISPSSHIPSSLQPKGLSSHTTTTTATTTDKTIPFPFGHNSFSPNFSSATLPPPHQKRLNPQELYEYYRCYGERLWDMTQQVYRGEMAPPGRAFTYAELSEAWTRVNEPAALIPAFEAWSRDTFGRVIGRGEVNATTMKQDKEYISITGTEEDATNARYEALYIPSAGTIIALNIHSPLNLLMRENAAMGLSPASAATIVPSLHRWTDMAWFLWSDIFARSSSPPKTNQPGSSIQYIGHDLITNDDTRYTI
ncbi:MAG: hypothetical protein Q9194_006334, partial [Teloschistes cf. exilis]